uniref:Homeobox domain-containing protein n=1 Tax=Romanomermis culicivorax TaxID=13658 RepID=A0A915JGY3_ROMCU
MPSPCNEGQEERLSAFVYLCQNQRLVPIACMFSDDSRIRIGQTGREGDFMKSCQQTKFGGMEKKIVGCIDENGQSIQANAVFQKQGVPNKYSVWSEKMAQVVHLMANENHYQPPEEVSQENVDERLTYLELENECMKSKISNFEDIIEKLQKSISELTLSAETKTTAGNSSAEPTKRPVAKKETTQDENEIDSINSDDEKEKNVPKIEEQGFEQNKPACQEKNAKSKDSFGKNIQHQNQGVGTSGVHVTATGQATPTKFTDGMKDELERSFAQEQYPKFLETLRLANALEVDRSVITSWFDRRRSREKNGEKMIQI